MHFTQILGLSLFAVGQVSCAALPANSTAINVSTPVPRGELVDRASAEPVQCGSGGDIKAYGSEDVKRAYNNGKTLWKNFDSSRCTPTGNCYPKSYGGNGGNVRSFLPAECDANSKSGTLVEWPLMEDHSIFQGGIDSGKDRIVMFDPAKDGKTVIFCGVMSHRNRGTNFDWCPRATS
ncbi:hypothetical protein UCDDS831_g03145 [Diplodia seriata]|uniref:Uncharacterized protein n=1 Tax=Diplodia seriata TaxID=420778 RepID=A0A0G2EM79_9PEZI|nr:hypothetical protein UCDDS831_g03145 [Diplodia seriata]